MAKGTPSLPCETRHWFGWKTGPGQEWFWHSVWSAAQRPQSELSSRLSMLKSDCGGSTSTWEGQVCANVVVKFCNTCGAKGKDTFRCSCNQRRCRYTVLGTVACSRRNLRRETSVTCPIVPSASSCHWVRRFHVRSTAAKVPGWNVERNESAAASIHISRGKPDWLRSSMARLRPGWSTVSGNATAPFLCLYCLEVQSLAGRGRPWWFWDQLCSWSRCRSIGWLLWKQCFQVWGRGLQWIEELGLCQDLFGRWALLAIQGRSDQQHHADQFVAHPRWTWPLTGNEMSWEVD